jgi:hypothetical protein
VTTMKIVVTLSMSLSILIVPCRPRFPREGCDHRWAAWTISLAFRTVLVADGTILLQKDISQSLCKLDGYISVYSQLYSLLCRKCATSWQLPK